MRFALFITSLMMAACGSNQSENNFRSSENSDSESAQVEQDSGDAFLSSSIPVTIDPVQYGPLPTPTLPEPQIPVSGIIIPSEFDAVRQIAVIRGKVALNGVTLGSEEISIRFDQVFAKSSYENWPTRIGMTTLDASFSDCIRYAQISGSFHPSGSVLEFGIQFKAAKQPQGSGYKIPSGAVLQCAITKRVIRSVPLVKSDLLEEKTNPKVPETTVLMRQPFSISTQRSGAMVLRSVVTNVSEDGLAPLLGAFVIIHKKNFPIPCVKLLAQDLGGEASVALLNFKKEKTVTVKKTNVATYFYPKADDISVTCRMQ